jgi:diguanylate cyclase
LIQAKTRKIEERGADVVATNQHEEELQHNAELIRQALPLMAQHGVPATPRNYAVWYQYIAGGNPALSAQIDDMLRRNASFTPEINESLYAEYASECDVTQLLQIRQEVETIVVETGDTLSSTNNSTSRFGESLERFTEECKRNPSMQVLGDLLTSVLQETRDMQSTAEMMRRSFEDKSAEIKALQKELEEVRRQATRDSLTGLDNRSTFMNALEEAVERLADSGGELCVVLFDIDHFKRINDTYGHLVGDKVIRFVAELLRKNIKGKDTACRFGGEEFTLLLPDTPLLGARRLAENILKELAGSNLVRTGTREPLGKITLSAGVAICRGKENCTNLIERADQALYRSKHNGRNRVTVENDH